MKSDINFKNLAFSLLIACEMLLIIQNQRCCGSTPQRQCSTHLQTKPSNHIHFKYIHMDRNIAIEYFDTLKFLKKKKKGQELISELNM